MDTQAFVAAVQGVSPVLNTSLSFNRDGFPGLRKLRLYIRSSQGSLALTRLGDPVNMDAVLTSNEWGSDLNRTYVLKGLQKAPVAWLEAMAKDVQSVSPAR